MANETLNFTINLNGNAYKGVLHLGDAISEVTKGIKKAKSSFEKLLKREKKFTFRFGYYRNKSFQ
jgi:hypothetical protein